jgi:hypothetical protein
MAHGYLSYQDTRGESNILGDIVKAVKSYLDGREKKEQVADMVAAKVDVEAKEQEALAAGKSAPRLPMGAQKMLTGGSFSKLVGRNPKALPGSVATTPDVRGGAIVNMGFGGRKLKPEGYVGDQIVDVSATPVNDSQEIVQAIDRLTFVTMNLLAATKEQTAVARDQQNFFEKLARKDKAALEESELEKGRDLSGNQTPIPISRRLPPAGGTGGGGSRKDMGDFLKTAARRGVSANKAAGQAVAKGSRFGAVTLARMGAKSPLKAYNMVPKVAQNASDLLFGTKRAAPIVKKLAVGAKVGKEAVTAGAAAGKAIKAGVSPSVVNKIAKKSNPALLKLLAGSEELDGIRRLSNIAAGADDGANAAKLTSRLLAEGYDKPQVAKIVADQFPNAGKVLSEGVTNTATAKLAGKVVGKGIGKSVLKKIPIIAGLAGIAFGVQRALEGDFLGAGLEIASGVMGATGVGAGASLGIDGFLLARDLGATPFAKGGIITRPTMGLVGETGQAEGVFPLQGSEGKKTFQMFGNAFIDAQKKRRREVAEIQAEGLELFSKKREYMKVFDFFNPFKGRNNDGNNGGNNGNTQNRRGSGVNGRSSMVGPPPPVSNRGGAKGVLDVIASVESNGSYDVFNTARGGTPGKATEKTIGWLANNAQGAIGRYQHMPEFILERAKRFGYNADTVFTPEVQDDITIKMMQEQHGLDDFLSGNMSASKFAAKLAPTWRGLPQGQKAADRLGGTADSTYMDQYSSGNKAHMSWADSVANFERIQAGAGQIPQFDPDVKYKTGDLVIKDGQVRQFDGMGWASPSGNSSQNFQLQSSNPNAGTDIQLASAETSLSAAANTGGTTIINNYSASSGDGSRSVANQVDFGPSNADMGGDLFTNTRIRTLVA